MDGIKHRHYAERKESVQLYIALVFFAKIRDIFSILINLLN